MSEFNLRCQMRFPKRCDLPIVEKEKLEGSEKYKAFLMYQFRDNDNYLKETMRDYFKSPSYFLYDADDIRGTGVKFCKICKLAQACDFGIAVLSPENENVFLEVGLLIGMGKPCLYVVNESRLKEKDIKKVPFDISDQIVVKYDSQEKLLAELEKEVHLFIPKVQLLSGYEKELRKNVKERLERLKPKGREDLKKIVGFGEVGFTRTELKLWGIEGSLNTLQTIKFISFHFNDRPFKAGLEVYSIEEAYRPILQELLFADEGLNLD